MWGYVQLPCWMLVCVFLFMVELTIYWSQMHQPSLQPKTTRPQNPFMLSGTGICTISPRSTVFFGVKIKAWVYPLLEEICLHLYVYFMFILACGGCLVFYCVKKKKITIMSSFLWQPPIIFSTRNRAKKSKFVIIPIPSMYDIFPYIYHKNQPFM